MHTFKHAGSTHYCTLHPRLILNWITVLNWAVSTSIRFLAVMWGDMWVLCKKHTYSAWMPDEIFECGSDTMQIWVNNGYMPVCSPTYESGNVWQASQPAKWWGPNSAKMGPRPVIQWQCTLCEKCCCVLPGIYTALVLQQPLPASLAPCLTCTLSPQPVLTHLSRMRKFPRYFVHPAVCFGCRMR